MFPAAAKDPEGFMAAVLARRRNPGGPREQYLSSGISLQVSDYRMKDGSLVSVYTVSPSRSSVRPRSRRRGPKRKPPLSGSRPRSNS